MKLRRLSALWLLSTYLLSIVGAACVALSCRCVHTHRHDDRLLYCSAHCCEAGCCAHVAGEHSGPEISCSCCNHDHSTETALYTAGGDRESHQVRAAVSLPDALAPDESDSSAVSAWMSGAIFPEISSALLSAGSLCRALRAPPSCA